MLRGGMNHLATGNMHITSGWAILDGVAQQIAEQWITLPYPHTLTICGIQVACGDEANK